MIGRGFQPATRPLASILDKLKSAKEAAVGTAAAAVARLPAAPKPQVRAQVGAPSRGPLRCNACPSLPPGCKWND